MEKLLLDQVENIGLVAGRVWHYLNDHGPVTLSRLVRELAMPRDQVLLGVGWLGREGKIVFQEGRRGRLIALADGLKTAPPPTDGLQGKAPWLHQVLQQLDLLLTVPENWDSYGAAAPRPEAVQAARTLANQIAENTSLLQPDVSPTRTGGVFLQWKNAHHEMEAQIESQDNVSFLYENLATEETVVAETLTAWAHDPRFLNLLRDHFVLSNVT